MSGYGATGGASRGDGAFPAPPTGDPAVALHSAAVADLQRLHNHLAVTRPRALAAASQTESAVDVAIRLIDRLVPERP